MTTETKALLTNVFKPWRYTGQYQDVATGLYKMGARYYQPELGRWTQIERDGPTVSKRTVSGIERVNRP